MSATGNPTDSTSSFLKLYELQKESLDKRRDIEWKVALAFWTSIGVATGFLMQKVQLPAKSMAFFILAFLVFGSWLCSVWYANEIDHRWIDVYRSNAEKALSCRPDTTPYIAPCKIGFLSNIWALTQILITAFFLYASWYLLTTVQPVPPK